MELQQLLVRVLNTYGELLALPFRFLATHLLQLKRMLKFGHIWYLPQPWLSLVSILHRPTFILEILHTYISMGGNPSSISSISLPCLCSSSSITWSPQPFASREIVHLLLSVDGPLLSLRPCLHLVWFEARLPVIPSSSRAPGHPTHPYPLATSPCLLLSHLTLSSHLPMITTLHSNSSSCSLSVASILLLQVLLTHKFLPDQIYVDPIHE